MKQTKRLKHPIWRTITPAICMALLASGSLHGQTAIETIIHDLSQAEGKGLEGARSLAGRFAAGNGDDLGYHSTMVDDFKTFEGIYTPPKLPEAMRGRYLYGLALLSDDGCTVTIDGRKVHDRYKRGQALPKLEYSFYELPVLLTPGKPVRLRVDYSNIYYGADRYVDIDGVTLFLYRVSAEIIPDYNRDGKIDDADRGQVTRDNPWRWWVNDDDDKVCDGRGSFEDDIPARASGARDCDNLAVDGIRDHIDFFPLRLDLGTVLGAFPAKDYRYVLSHPEQALNFYEYAGCIPENATTQGPSRYIRSVSAGMDYGSQALTQVTENGVSLSAELLNAISKGRGVILVEAVTKTKKPLTLEVKAKADDKTVLSTELPLALDEVENMYRHLNLRADLGGSGGHQTQTGEPSGYPDALTSERYVAYLHGYNNDGNVARGAQAELFKRFHQLGSRARFIGISWFGDPPNPGLNTFLPADYHRAVGNGLITGMKLRSELGFTQSSGLTLLAHSLGNSVASNAIANHGLKVTQYFIINGAIPLEAYDAYQVANSSGDPDMARNMTEDDWKRIYDYKGGSQRRLLAANWHRLFAVTPKDHRNQLTWRNLFANPELLRVAYNFYSPSDEIVENPYKSEEFGNWKNLWDTAHGGRHAWVQQEIAKGGQNFFTREAFHDLNGGWRFSGLWMKMSGRKPGEGTLREKMSLAEMSRVPDADLIAKPYFTRFMYEDLHDVLRGDAVAADPIKKYKLLGTGVPATSYAIASNESEPLMAGYHNPVARNYNMPKLLKSSEGRRFWPAHQNSKRDDDWMHGDFKDVALNHVGPMYELIVKLANLKN